MFDVIKFTVWLAGIAVIAFIVLNYFGYELNRDYFNESKSACQKRLEECTKEVLRKGTENARCDFNCVDPKLIIKKK